MDDERPVHMVVDCSPRPDPVFDDESNEIPQDLPPRVTLTPLTDEEWAQHKARSAEHAAAVQAEAAERDRLAALAAAHPDPLVQALARKAGLA